MRPKNPGLQQKILHEAKQLAAQQGTAALSIRAVAARCGVAPGTVYNYFESKDAILLAMAVEFWRDALRQLPAQANSGVFVDDLAVLYPFLVARMDDFRAGLLGGIRHGGAAGIRAGKAKEGVMQAKLRGHLLLRIQNDACIDPAVFSETFAAEGCAALVLDALLAALERRQPDIDFLLETLRRLLYPHKGSQNAAARA